MGKAPTGARAFFDPLSGTKKEARKKEGRKYLENTWKLRSRAMQRARGPIKLCARDPKPLTMTTVLPERMAV